jgi:hypothetical protein
MKRTTHERLIAVVLMAACCLPAGCRRADRVTTTRNSAGFDMRIEGKTYATYCDLEIVRNSSAKTTVARIFGPVLVTDAVPREQAKQIESVEGNGDIVLRGGERLTGKNVYFVGKDEELTFLGPYGSSGQAELTGIWTNEACRGLLMGQLIGKKETEGGSENFRDKLPGVQVSDPE